MHEKARLSRRQAVVAPLSGQHRDQFLIRSQRFQHLPCGLEANARHQQFAGAGVQTTDGSRHCLAGKELRRLTADLSDQLDIALDGLRLAREMSDKFSREFAPPGAKVIHALADHHAVVNRIHRRPVKLAVGDDVKDPAQHSLRLVHFANVVDANIPLVALARIAVRVATRRVMLLQHTNPFAEPGQQRRRAQAPDARADHDHVVMLGSEPGAKTRTRANPGP